MATWFDESSSICESNHIESTNERTNDWSEVFKRFSKKKKEEENTQNNNSNSIRYEREHIFKMELNERKPVVYFALHMGLEKQKYIHSRTESNRKRFGIGIIRFILIVIIQLHYHRLSLTLKQFDMFKSSLDVAILTDRTDGSAQWFSRINIVYLSLWLNSNRSFDGIRFLTLK